MTNVVAYIFPNLPSACLIYLIWVGIKTRRNHPTRSYRYIKSIFVDYREELIDEDGKLFPYEECRIKIAQIIGEDIAYPREWHLRLRSFFKETIEANGDSIRIYDD